MVYNTKNFGAVFFIFSKVTSPPAADVSSTRGAVALQLLRHRAQEFCFGDVTFVKLRQWNQGISSQPEKAHDFLKIQQKSHEILGFDKTSTIFTGIADFLVQSPQNVGPPFN
jgi:hypothetical protein